MYIDESLSSKLGISKTQFITIKRVMSQFLVACQQHKQGLVIGGIDFAIGKVGGKFGADVILGIQDPAIYSVHYFETQLDAINNEKVKVCWQENDGEDAVYLVAP